MEKRDGFGEMPPCSSASLCWSAAGFLPEPLKTHPELSGQETSANSLFIFNVSAPFSGVFFSSSTWCQCVQPSPGGCDSVAAPLCNHVSALRLMDNILIFAELCGV